MPNDIELGGGKAAFIILTGPNMGGAHSSHHSHTVLQSVTWLKLPISMPFRACAATASLLARPSLQDGFVYHKGGTAGLKEWQ